MTMMAAPGLWKRLGLDQVELTALDEERGKCADPVGCVGSRSVSVAKRMMGLQSGDWGVIRGWANGEHFSLLAVLLTTPHRPHFIHTLIPASVVKP